MKTGNDRVARTLLITASLILAASFFIMKEKEKYHRISQEQELRLTQERNMIIESELQEAARVNKAITEELKFEKQWSYALEEQLQEKEKQVELALNQIEEKTETIDKLLEKIEVEKVIRTKLEKVLKETRAQLTLAMHKAPGSIESPEDSKEDLREETSLRDLISKEPIELEKIVVKSTPLVNGKVLMVNKEYDFVVFDLGKANKLARGERLSVYRGNKFVARIEVDKVKEKLSAATVLPQFRQQEIRKDDVVRGL